MASRKAIALAACLSLTGLTVAGCGGDKKADTTTTTAAATATTVATTTTTGAPVEVKKDIVATALGASVFTTLAGLVVDAGLVDALRGDGPLTVFAPTDDAFKKVPLDLLHTVQDDKKLLATVLTYHVVPGKLTLADLKPGKLTTLAGIDLEVTRQGNDVFINGNKIIIPDVEASNGIVQVVDGVLVPPS